MEGRDASRCNGEKSSRLWLFTEPLSLSLPPSPSLFLLRSLEGADVVFLAVGHVEYARVGDGLRRGEEGQQREEERQDDIGNPAHGEGIEHGSGGRKGEGEGKGGGSTAAKKKGEDGGTEGEREREGEEEEERKGREGSEVNSRFAQRGRAQHIVKRKVKRSALSPLTI